MPLPIKVSVLPPKGRGGRERNISKPRTGGTTKGRLDGEAFPRAGDGREEGRPHRGRGPLGTIGSPAIRGINMLDTSPPRGNAFVTPGNISAPFSIYLSLSRFLSIPRCPIPRLLSSPPLFTLALRVPMRGGSPRHPSPLHRE